MAATPFGASLWLANSSHSACNALLHVSCWGCEGLDEVSGRDNLDSGVIG